MRLLLIELSLPLEPTDEEIQILKKIKFQPSYIFSKKKLKKQAQWVLYVKPTQIKVLQKYGFEFTVIKDLRDIKDPREYVSQKNRFLKELEMSRQKIGEHTKK